jgi:hypothetical protein
MPGPYDYTINIPQPPANNFLQSLLGIQQLKGLQQQSEISAQQAQFAAQMQPLQLEAERAKIGQIGQLTATSEENMRQGKLTFEQAQQDRTRGMEQQAIAQARQQELFGKLNSLPATASMSEIVPIANQLALINPGMSKQVMENFQAQPEEYQKALKTSLLTATTYLEAGKTDEAIKTYNTFEQAVRNSAGKNSQLLAMADGAKAQAMLLEANPNLGKLSALQALGIIDPKALDSIVGLEKEGKQIQGKTVDEEKRALPSAILRDNVAIEKKVTAANEMADKLSQAAEAMRALPSVGSAKEWWTNVKPKLGFGENPEIAVRSNAAQLAGLGMLGAESSAMGGAIRSNVQFQYATSKLPDAWSAPQELAKRLDAQAEVQRKLAQIMTIDAEWNSAFRGSQKATKDEQILGMDVAPGTTKAQFKQMAAKALFPSESAAPAPTKTDKITGTPDLIGGQRRQQSAAGLPTGGGAADFGLFNINGEEVRVTPKGK